MKKVGIVIVVILVLIGGLVLAKNMLVQSLIINGAKAVTGLELTLGSADIGVLKTFLTLKDLKILNPKGFSENIMADFPEIYVQYDLGGFFKGKTHLQELRINLKEFVVVRNKQNQVNINSLKALLPKGGGKPPEIQIDVLHLTINKVIYKDDAMVQPSSREFNVNINETFNNITDPNALVKLIVIKSLSKTTIPDLANINIGQLKEEVSGAVTQQAEGVVKEIKEKATETLMKTEGAIGKFFQPKE